MHHAIFRICLINNSSIYKIDHYYAATKIEEIKQTEINFDFLNIVHFYSSSKILKYVLRILI